MFLTLESVKLLDLTDELSTMILQSTLVEDYLQCLYTLRADKTAQQLINEFNQWKEKYDEVKRFGSYHPDYLAVVTKTREIKREMDLHPAVAAFKKAETELQQLLDEISQIIAHTVSEHIKVPTGNPFFTNTSSCGGGCSSGGSCGCSS